MRIRRLLVNSYLCFIGMVVLFYGIVNERIATGFTTGDWLINYRAGFVRRGLAGQVIWFFSRATGASLVWIVFAVQIACYAIFLAVVWKLAKRSALPYWAMFLIFSPATLAFLVFSHHAGFRKEILFYAALSLLLVFLSKQSNISRVGLGFGLAIAASMLVLSHEAIFFYLPYFAAVVYIIGGSVGSAFRILIVPVVIATLSLAAAVHWHGDARQAAAICDSFGSATLRHQPTLCGGDVAALGESEIKGHTMALEAAEGDNYYVRYGFTGLLAFLPVIAAFLDLWRDPSKRSNLVALGILGIVSIFASGVLLTVSVDWGRWLSMHVISLFLILLFLSSYPSVNAAEKPREKRAQTALIYALLALYTLLWNVPFYGREPYTGYIGLFRVALSFARSGRAGSYRGT